MSKTLLIDQNLVNTIRTVLLSSKQEVATTQQMVNIIQTLNNLPEGAPVPNQEETEQNTE